MRRRRFLAAAAGGGIAATSGCLSFHSRRESPVNGETTVGLEPVVDDLSAPTSFASVADDEVWYVAERSRGVMVVDGSGSTAEPLLDLRDRLSEIRLNRGVLGVEPHPEFETTRKLYVRYSAPIGNRASWDSGHTFVLSEFRVDDDLHSANPASERRIFEFPIPGRHNAGDLAFGPDGYLYTPVGDGGHYAVNPSTDWYGNNDVGEAGQDLTQNLWGSVLRIDVDSREDGKPYAVPDDNPLVGRDGLDEQFAWGFRNPYRMSFNDGEPFVADVGTDTLEEVNVVQNGGNYGWSVKEGNTCADSVQLRTAIENDPLNALRPKYWIGLWNEVMPYRTCPDRTPDGKTLRDPVISFHAKGGQAVIGGYTWERNAVKSLQGAYVFANLAAGTTTSPLFAAMPPADGEDWIDGGPRPVQRLKVAGDHPGRGNVLSFGRDGAGRVYVLSTKFQPGTGRIYRLKPPG